MKFAKYWESIETKPDQDVFSFNPQTGEKLDPETTFTVWGASNESPESAMQRAKERLKKFETMVQNGFTDKSDYEYGFIREEVLDEILADDGTVIAALTRNNYGAIILNAVNVMFGDVDESEHGFFSRLFGKKKKDKDYYLAKIEQYQKENPELAIIVYETFAGLRFVITNHTYDLENTHDRTEMLKLFAALEVDPLYLRLCQQQGCFRARLTPKPWRINTERPPSRYPRSDRRDINDFEDWLKDYEMASTSKTVVKVLKEFGSANTHPDVRKILEIHDRHALKGLGELA